MCTYHLFTFSAFRNSFGFTNVPQPGEKGCIARVATTATPATRKVFAWRTFAWHFTLATRLEHFTFNTSCIVLPSGGSALAASVSVRAAFPSIPASQLVTVCVCVCVCLFAFVKGREGERVFHEFSLSFAAKYSLLIPARGRQSSVARVCFVGTLVH